jgi:predicted PurR-regulated permease PerM
VPTANPLLRGRLHPWIMQRVTRRGLNFLLVIFAVLTALLLLTVIPFFPYVFFGAFAGFLVYPIYSRLARRIGNYFAAWVMVALVYAAIFIPIAALVASIIRDLMNAAIVLRERGAESIIFGVLQEILPDDMAEQLAAFVGNALVDMGLRLAQQALPVAMEILLGMFIFGFICFYTLLKGSTVVQFTREVVPLRDFRVVALFQQIKLSLNAVFYGVIFVAVIQGTAGGIVWWIAGLPNPFFYGAVMFLLSIIPFAGPSFVLIPVGVLALLQDNIGMGVFLIASGVFFVGSIDNFLRPIMVSRFGDINPAMVVVGLAGGLVAFGLVGMVLGPLIFALWVGVARELHFEVREWKKHAFTEDDEIDEERRRRELFQMLTGELDDEGPPKDLDDEGPRELDPEPGRPSPAGGGPAGR